MKTQTRKQLERADAGKSFGYFGGQATKQIYLDSTATQICDFVSRLQNKHSPMAQLRIADVGGGNGIVARALRGALSEYQNLSIEVLDYDPSKFNAEDPKIIYTQHNALTSLTKHYDGIISRYVLHYNSPADQIKIIRNISNGLSEDGLVCLIDAFPLDEEQITKATRLHKELATLAGANAKYWSLEGETQQLLQNANLRILSASKQPYSHDLEFYKPRYNLNEEQTRAIESFFEKNGPILGNIITFNLERKKSIQK